MKCAVIVAVVVTSSMDFVFANGDKLITRDTIIPDTTKQEVLFALATQLQDDEVTWTKVEVKDLPEAVTKAMGAKYEGYTVKEAYKGSNDQYKLSVQKDEKTLVVIFDKDGNFISEVEG